MNIVCHIFFVLLFHWVAGSIDRSPFSNCRDRRPEYARVVCVTANGDGQTQEGVELGRVDRDQRRRECPASITSAVPRERHTFC